MTQYMLSVHHDGTEDFESMSEEELQKIFAAVDKFNEEVKARATGSSPAASSRSRTAPRSTRTGDAPVITDGPFAESKEFLGGFWIIEAADLDEALDWARRGLRRLRRQGRGAPLPGRVTRP